MSVELHVRTRGGLRPDPEWDPVLIVFYYVHNDWSSDGNTLGIIAIDLSLNIPSTPTKKPNASPSKKFQSSPAKILLGKQSKKRLTDDDIENILTLIGSDDNDRPYLDHCGVSDDIHITYVADEKELFDELIKLVRGCDPDILLGYEVQMLSWGYLKARASYLGINLIGQLSRVPNMKTRVAPSGGHHMTSSSDFNVTGRIMLSVWRSMKDEVALTSYAFENVLYHVLKRRVPHFYYSILTDWYDYHDRLYRNRVVEYYVLRCYGNYQLLEKFNIIGRMSELARLYGIEFQSVLSRGSQYRVESMMLRLAKQSNFIAASPSVQQRSRMAAPECLPLIMEPESKFYSDPILVLDFQSLYPSIIIAYNYCFSTCLGRVKNLINNDGFTFGTCSLRISGNDLKVISFYLTQLSVVRRN
jgi:DNA polymerase zeta